MAVSCPPTVYPCPYGIDFSSKGELIAAERENEKAIAEFIGLDSMHYLSMDGMVKATGLDKDCFCRACFDGHYAVRLPEILDKFCMEMK